MKQCSDCKQEKPIDEFSWRSTEKRYRKSYCKPCDALRSRRWALNNPNYHREWAAANVERLRASWRRRSKPKLQFIDTAHKAVRRALAAGKLTRPDTCEECGLAGKINAAHHNYGRPLDVRWLCRSCHTKWDASEPKTNKKD